MLTRQLRDYWSKLGLRISGANSPQEIRRFETQRQVTLPRDMRDYFARIGGMRENEIDPESLMAFWPLPELTPMFSQSPDLLTENVNGYFAFADWSINALVYRINLTSGASGYGSIAIRNGDKLIPIAASFTEFIHTLVSAKK
jgi:hypothetical protein